MIAWAVVIAAAIWFIIGYAFGAERGRKKLNDLARIENERICKLKSELAEVDNALSRRDACEGIDRVTAIYRACEEAAKAAPAISQAKHWEFHYDKQRERAERAESALAEKAEELDALAGAMEVTTAELLKWKHPRDAKGHFLTGAVKELPDESRVG